MNAETSWEVEQDVFEVTVEHAIEKSIKEGVPRELIIEWLDAISERQTQLWGEEK